MTHANLMNNYFNPNSVYTEDNFRRHFRMRRHVFERLLHDVHQVNPYFQQKLDRAGCLGSSLVDLMDETHGMSESTCLDTLAEFCNTIVQLYKEEYLCKPNQEDMDRLIRKAEYRGFPGMIRSLDCMHWNWKNCPTEWQWGFSGMLRKKTIMLKVVASYETWI
ncbi:uncharacterized protein LOC126595314 [Malus sylvestris]|uniref:uncharacterized protein LOC126595314 n=1 Tax=Malus sylvestris TaxID=3752 RepID=UPI0021AD4392|nr:uncharacterized protein LOC126595314 [Malus sylvestris]